MSLDLDLMVVRPTSVFSTNMTHNVTNMWREAGVYDALYMSQGKLAGDFVRVLDAGVVDMSTHPEKYRPMSDPEGWGTYAQAFTWLKEVRDAFKENPDATIEVWK
jgi:hypothetical protein